MKTLLLNGCSFGHRWHPSKEFVNALGCDQTENISKVATSFQRTCRSTIEWIAINGNPSFVVVIGFLCKTKNMFFLQDRRLEVT